VRCGVLAVGHACDLWQVQSSGDWHWDFYCHWQDQRCNGGFTGGTASSSCCSVPCCYSMVCASAVHCTALNCDPVKAGEACLGTASAYVGMVSCELWLRLDLGRKTCPGQSVLHAHHALSSLDALLAACRLPVSSS
jgi:hypothetical protein